MTVGAQTTGISHAGIHTAFVLAVLVPRTIIITCAFGARNLRHGNVRGIAFDAWITLVTSRTTALRIMIACIALSIDTATLQVAGIQATAMQTHLRAGALSIMLTAARDDDRLDGHTVARIVRDSVAGTLADHGAKR